MNNITGISISTNGEQKRLTVIYDVYDDAGLMISANMRANRIMTSEELLSASDVLTEYAKTIVEE